jgi:hypothetical protein
MRSVEQAISNAVSAVHSASSSWSSTTLLDVWIVDAGAFRRARPPHSSNAAPPTGVERPIKVRTSCQPVWGPEALVWTSSRRWTRARRRTLAVAATTSFLFLGARGIVLAETGAPSSEPIVRLEQQLLDLQRQIAEMERRHAEEIGTLKEEIRILREEGTAPVAASEDELAELRRRAEAEAARAEEPEKGEKEAVFTAKGLSLQALNPEISVTGDMLTTYVHRDGLPQHSNVMFRTLGLHLESYLDPYTRFKAAVPVFPGGAELGEAYMMRYGLLEGFNLTFGKFRQQFGVVNRWHKHGLDQTDFPLALRQIFGEGGLNQTGFSFDWVLPRLGNASQELTAQITNGENGRLFSGSTLSTPSLLLHYKNYRDLSPSTYLELGLSGLLGWKDEWTVEQDGALVTVPDRRPARVFGLDVNLVWEPTDRMRYRNVVWRSELYLLDRDILAPDGSGPDSLFAWGAFTYLESKLNRKVDLGIRLDYFKPDQKSYAARSLAPQAYPDDVHFWQLSPYLTFQQSPFVKYRLEYSHLERKGAEPPEDSLTFQLIFAAGPHKHERY